MIKKILLLLLLFSVTLIPISVDASSFENEEDFVSSFGSNMPFDRVEFITSSYYNDTFYGSMSNPIVFNTEYNNLPYNSSNNTYGLGYVRVGKVSEQLTIHTRMRTNASNSLFKELYFLEESTANPVLQSVSYDYFAFVYDEFGYDASLFTDLSLDIFPHIRVWFPQLSIDEEESFSVRMSYEEPNVSVQNGVLTSLTFVEREYTATYSASSLFYDIPLNSTDFPLVSANEFGLNLDYMAVRDLRIEISSSTPFAVSYVTQLGFLADNVSIDKFYEDLINGYGHIDVRPIDVDFTSWLVTAVGSFMDFELIPGFSISGIFMIMLSFMLVVAILKYFLGG